MANLARRASVEIPDQSGPTEGLIAAYAKSPVRAFHDWYYSQQHDPPETWPQTYDRTPLDRLLACARCVLDHPNDLLLTPSGGPSPFYDTETAMSLVALPTMPPAAPRLGISFNPATGGVAIACSAEAGRFVTLLTSADGGRSWTAVPGYDDRLSDGNPLTYELGNPTGAAFFCARAR